MSRDPDRATVLALAGCVGLAIPDEALPGVVAFLRVAADHARLLESLPFDDAELDLAPVFRLPFPGEDGDVG